MSDYISHSGVAHDENPPGRGSGRYAWGVGMNPEQGGRRIGFLEEVEKMRKQGFTDTEIARALIGPKQTGVDLKAMITIEKKKEKDYQISRAKSLYDKYNQNITEVARRMNKPVSTINDWLKNDISEQKSRYYATAEFLKKKVDESESGILDVSKSVEHILGVPQNTKEVAIAMLQDEGYIKTWVKIPRVGDKTGDKFFNTEVLVKPLPGESISDTIQRAKNNKFNIDTVTEFSPDEGGHFFVPEKPARLDASRIYVRYDEDGGSLKDGVIEIRPGVKDLDMGGSAYCQARINVEDTHYLKGMAILSEDIPEGYDIVYNTNKKRGTPIMSDDRDAKQVFKPNEVKNPDNPFGATIIAGGQNYYEDPKGDYILDANGVYKKATPADSGKPHYSLSKVNKVRDAGDWQDWSKTIATQFLSKQPQKLIDQQIDLSLKHQKVMLEEIQSLTNPVIKKQLLNDFAGKMDSNAAELKVEGFKKQAFQVILPVPDMPPNEVYAPNYKDGEKVALIRYPHGGIFEIPICTVKNKGSSVEKIWEPSKMKDAIGISPETAQQLSGADFDGDTVLVIPMTSNKINVQNSKPLQGLKNFNTKQYALPYDSSNPDNPWPKGKKPISYDQMQVQMGIVTNLITDMTAAGAPLPEIERAVKHSMVIIDSYKHKLDWKQSAKDNNIAELHKKYQGYTEKYVDEETGEIIEQHKGGASTIFSRSNRKIYVDQIKEVTRVSDMTPEEKKRWDEGKVVYRVTGKKKYAAIKDEDGNIIDYEDTGKMKQSHIKETLLVDDMMDLVREKDNPKEVAYAKYGNALKELANAARKEARTMKMPPVNKEARIKYAKEVEELNDALIKAELNSPKERAAHRLATTMAKQIMEENPNLDDDRKKKLTAQQLTKARAIVGAHKEKIEITDSQWEAIQAGAISTAKLQRILLNTDQDAFKERAMPHNRTALTPAKEQLLKSMIASGRYTNAELAEALGISVSTVNKYKQ